MTSFLASIATLLAISCTAATCAVAQVGPDTGSAAHRRWTVEGVVGVTAGYSQRDVVRKMRSAGLGVTSEPGCLFGLCAGSIPHPNSSGGGDVRMLMAAYRVNSFLDVRATAAFPGWIGETTGYGGNLDYVAISTRTTNFGGLLGLNATPAVRLLAGLSVDHVRVTSGLFGGALIASKITGGAWFGAQLRIPARRRLFASLTVLRHVSTAVHAGPLEWQSLTTDASRTLDEFAIHANYTLIGWGGGVNF